MTRSDRSHRSLNPTSLWALHTVGRALLSACGSESPTWYTWAEGCLVPFSRRQEVRVLKTVLFQCIQVGSITKGVSSQSLLHSASLFFCVLLCPFILDGKIQNQLHAVSWPRPKLYGLGFTIFAFLFLFYFIFACQIRKLRFKRGQWFEPVISLTPELCPVPCPPYTARLSALCQLDLAGVFHVKIIFKPHELVCVCFSLIFFFPLKFLASQPGIEKPRAI